jgi:hypothetical protein
MPDQLQDTLVKRRLLDIVPPEGKSPIYGLPGVAGIAAPEEALMLTNEFQPWSGAKQLVDAGKGLWNAAKGKLGMAAEEAPWQKLIPEPALPASPPDMIPKGNGLAPINPKPGGVLYQVLERAALKNGMGESLTPGESNLLNQFKPR